MICLEDGSHGEEKLEAKFVSKLLQADEFIAHSIKTRDVALTLGVTQ